MTEMFVKAALGFAAVYASCGFVFAVIFAARRMGGVDPAAEKGTVGFRLLVLPGVIAIWPVLLFSFRPTQSSLSGRAAFALRRWHHIAIVLLAIFAAAVSIAALVWRAPGFGDLPAIETPSP